MKKSQHRSAPKGQQHIAQGTALGVKRQKKDAPSGQKHSAARKAFALSGRDSCTAFTQGVALGYVLIGLSGRLFPNLRNSNEL